ncbi:MAG: methylated-DNA--[protein]-cysteine S-methyltransferase [Casimicrobiaceae bacterium]
MDPHAASQLEASAQRYAATLRAPFATLGLCTDGNAVSGLAYLPDEIAQKAPANRVAERAVREIIRYLDDPEFVFTVAFAPGGTPFQRRVWDAIRAIPLSESRTYGEIARAVRSAPRAVGQACGANRIALIIPCHRVVGSCGALGGFMGAAEGERPGADAADPLAIKRWLLRHEGYRFGR